MKHVLIQHEDEAIIIASQDIRNLELHKLVETETDKDQVVVILHYNGYDDIEDQRFYFPDAATAITWMSGVQNNINH